MRGVKLVEIVGISPGPFAGVFLAELGAEVTLIKRPDPETCGDDAGRELRPAGGREGVAQPEAPAGRRSFLSAISGGSAAVFEAPAVVARLDHVAVIGDAPKGTWLAVRWSSCAGAHNAGGNGDGQVRLTGSLLHANPQSMLWIFLTPRRLETLTCANCEVG